jgi:hypothetical protein
MLHLLAVDEGDGRGGGDGVVLEEHVDELLSHLERGTTRALPSLTIAISV